MSEDDDDNVGYGRPPKRSRFRKGQSGNPKGRPKGRLNNNSIIRSIMDRKVSLRDNGRMRTMPVSEAIAHQFIAKVLKGSTSDLCKAITLLAKYAPNAFDEPLPPISYQVHFVTPQEVREREAAKKAAEAQRRGEEQGKKNTGD